MSLTNSSTQAVSVSLPKWADTVGWATQEPRVVDAMRTGYPRFFVPRVVKRLAVRIMQVQSESKYSSGVETTNDAELLSLIFSTQRYAKMAHQILSHEHPGTDSGSSIAALKVKWNGLITEVGTSEEESVLSDSRSATPEEPLTPPFLAEHMVSNIEKEMSVSKTHGAISPQVVTCHDEAHENQPSVDEFPSGTEDIFIVSFPKDLFPTAKAIWQHTGFGISSRRAMLWLGNAPFLSGSSDSSFDGYKKIDSSNARTKIQARISAGFSSKDLQVNQNDVFLYPSGMTAITEAAVAVRSIRDPRNQSPCAVAVFGFLYVDTFKTLTRILGYDTKLYRYLDSEIDKLEADLESGTLTLDAVFTEFPGNPLLQSPDLSRLRDLSIRYNFFLIVDDTVGGYVNVNVLSSCDLVCTSLTKLFSGKCNVMGGSVVVSPSSRFSHSLHFALDRNHEDGAWFAEDVLVMEQNSRDFDERARKASSNAEKVVALLRAHPSVEEVYYPKGSPTEGIYVRFQRRSEGGGYGHLLSVRFKDPRQAVVFHDKLDVAKGPSLGTNFTLASPYSLLAHYWDLEWASEYGVVEHLVRMSVGLEEEEWLLERVNRALNALREC